MICLCVDLVSLAHVLQKKYALLRDLDKSLQGNITTQFVSFTCFLKIWKSDFNLCRKSKTERATVWKGDRGYKKRQNRKCYTQCTLLRGSNWWTEAQRQDCWWEGRFGYAGLWSGNMLLLKFLSSLVFLRWYYFTVMVSVWARNLCSLSLQLDYSIKSIIFQMMYCFRWICMFSNLTSTWKNPMSRCAEVFFFFLRLLFLLMFNFSF